MDKDVLIWRIKMGYRSEVAIKVYGDAENMASFNNAYAEAYSALSEEDQTYVNELMGEDVRNGWHDGIFTFHADYIKWYEGYGHIDFFTGLLEQVDDLGVNSEFIRIGEDHDDVVTEYQGDGGEYYLGVIRSIDGV